jgi:thioesterase domain-containing protein
VLFLKDLANHLSSDQPVYGLQAPGLDWDDQQPLSRVEELAALHIAAIRDVQPQGPYLFCGRCFGGHVAYQMALQLAAGGERVSDLIILDSSAPIGMGTPLPQSRPVLSKGRVRRAAVYTRNGELLSVLGKKLYKQSIKFVTGVRDAWLDRYADPRDRRMRRVESANWEAHRYYRAAPYAGRITLIRSREFASADSKDFHLEWSALALGGFEIHVIPGTHMGILQEPHVVNLAKTIEACIDEHARK